ncbi:hypothetical protein Dimus_001515 [Dionaea muscipula]
MAIAGAGQRRHWIRLLPALGLVVANGYIPFGGAIAYRPVEDVAFAITTFIQNRDSFVNYYMEGQGNLKAQLEVLLNVEKQMRLAGDVSSTKKTACDILC